MEPTPRSLMVDLLATAPEARLPVRTLVAAGDVFAFSSNRVRVALCRLRERGTVDCPRRGVYALTARAKGRNRHVQSWRDRERELVPWRGDLVTAIGEPDAEATRWLPLLGFRALRPALWLRPNNLRGGVAELRDRLRSMGVRGLVVAELRDLDRDDCRELRSRWDAAAIGTGHVAMRRRLERSAARLPELSAPAALRESFVVGGEAIRRLVLDPLLPPELCDPAPRRALTEAMRAYDKMGRARWRAFLNTPLANRAPADGAALRRAYAGAGG